MVYRVEDRSGNWIWTGWANNKEHAEQLARGCAAFSVSKDESLVVSEVNQM